MITEFYETETAASLLDKAALLRQLAADSLRGGYDFSARHFKCRARQTIDHASRARVIEGRKLP